MNIIFKLNYFSKYRVPKYLIFSDRYQNGVCCDKNAFYLFDYYINNNDDNAFYIINKESYLLKYLLNENKTKNLILYRNNSDLFENLFIYLLNAKIIVQSYVSPEFQRLVSEVEYLKYLKINHGIRYFKKYITSSEFSFMKKQKVNTIVSSPYEIELLTNLANLTKNQIYKAGLSRWDKLNFEKLNDSENCLLISFTYRNYDSLAFEKSLYKKNLYQFLNNHNLISFLKKRNIDLIYIPHHQELFLKKNYSQNNLLYAKIKSQEYLDYYIKQCSLFITDFSSISFDFMYQNKAVLFYFIDKNDKLNFNEKDYYLKDRNDKIYSGNAFIHLNDLIKNIIFFANNDFKITNKMKNNYESIFYYKNNITKRLIDIINTIIEKKY